MTRFGLSLPAGGRSSPAPGARSLADAAQRIEAAGFESIWAFDAIGRGFLMADPLTALSVAATSISRKSFAVLGRAAFADDERRRQQRSRRRLILALGGFTLFRVATAGPLAEPA